MADEVDELYPYRHSIVNELFIKTADDNYVTARWCYANGFDVDFFWLAVHALEKYLKAVLLLNGCSAKAAIVAGKKSNYGHDIVRLYADVKPLAPELLPVALICPSEIDNSSWHDATPEQFVQRLYNMGHADNRYQLTGYVLREGDLYKLDQLVFAVRRLCRPLEAHFFGKKQAGLLDKSFRQRMTKDHPVSANLYSRLEEIMGGKRGQEAKHTALNYNFPFAPKDYEHSTMRGLLLVPRMLFCCDKSSSLLMPESRSTTSTLTRCGNGPKTTSICQKSLLPCMKRSAPSGGSQRRTSRSLEAVITHEIHTLPNGFHQ